MYNIISIFSHTNTQQQLLFFDKFLIFILSQNVKITVMDMTMGFYGLIDLLWQPSPATTSAAHLEMMASLINLKNLS